MLRFLRSEKGFTMVEILVVVVILGILTGIAIPIVNSGLKKQKQNDCKNQCLVIQTAVQQAMFGMIDNGRKQEEIAIAGWPDSEVKKQYSPTGSIKFDIGEEYNDKYYTILNETLTLGQIRGGYNPGPEYTKKSCEDTGRYLKKKRLENVEFYKYLDNAEIPVCPFADDNNSQGYYYCIFFDGTVCCTCPECNEVN